MQPVTPQVVRTRPRRRLRGDAWTPVKTAVGNGVERSSRIQFMRRPELHSFRWMLDTLYEQDDISQTVVDRPADDMIRVDAGYSGLDADAVKGVNSEVEDLNAYTKLADGIRWGRLTGGGGVFVDVADGKDPSEPLVMAPGQFTRVVGIETFDRWEVYPEVLGQDATRSFYRGRPEMYQTATGRRIHASRLWIFTGNRVTPRRQRELQGWTTSVLDPVWWAIQEYGRAFSYLDQVLHSFTWDALYLEGLNNALLGDPEGDGVDFVVNKLEQIRLGMEVVGNMALDPGDASRPGDRYETTTRTVTGLPEIVDRFIGRLVTATKMPRIVLLGESVGGLGAGAEEGQLRVWYDQVNQMRRRQLSPAFAWIVRLILLSTDGPTNGREPDAWNLVWPSLWEPTPKQRAEARKLNAESRVLDRDAGVSTEVVMTDPDLTEHYDGDALAAEQGEPLPEPIDGAPVPGAEDGAAAVQETALNGAQVQALVEVARSTRPEGDPLPREAAVAIVQAAFPTQAGRAEAIVPPGIEPAGDAQASEADIPDDLISEPDARRLTKFGKREFQKMVAEGVIKVWARGNRRRYSRAQLARALGGGPSDGDGTPTA